jgi:four helix bundle protein
MATITRFEDIRSWQSARLLTRLIYELSRRGEFARDFSFRDQMRRAAVSVMSNIAEGFESRTQSQFIEYLGRAKASSGEVQSQAYIALDVEYIDEAQFEELYTLARETSRQISGFMAYLERLPQSYRLRDGGGVYTIEDDE